MTNKTYQINILADDYAVKADDVIEMVEKAKKAGNLPLDANILLERKEHLYNLYLEDSIDENNIGRIHKISGVKKSEWDKLLKSVKSIKITGWNEDTETFSADMLIDYDENAVTTNVSDIPEKVQKVLNAKLKEGILPELKETCEERIKYMLKNKVNLLDIIDVINYWDVDCINKLGPRIPTRYIDPNLANATNQGKSGVISRAVQTYLVGNPKILKGPKSTGKNTMINSVVWLFGDSIEEHTFTMQDSRADVISSEGTDNSAMERLKTISTKLLADAEKVKLTHSMNTELPYTKSEDEILLAEALFKQLSAEAGAVHIIHEYRGFARWLLDDTGHKCYVADEMNMADANLLVGLLHPILDGSITEFDLPGRGPVKLAKHLMMFATMNVGYAGEQEGNPATLSRFGAFELGQPASISGILHSAVQSELSKKNIKGDLEDKYYEQAENFYNACKAAAQGTSSYSSGELSDQCLNIRGIVRAMVETKRFEGRTTLNQKLEDEVVTACDDTERPMLLTLLNKTVVC